MSGRRWIVIALIAAAGLFVALTPDAPRHRAPAGHVKLPPPLPPPPAPPPRTPGFEIGLQDNAVFLQRDYYDRERAYAQARTLGVTWLRATLLWTRAAGATVASRTPPDHPAFDFSAFDDLVHSAAAHGLHVELTLTGPAPAWATSNHRIGVLAPDPRLFAEFAGAAAAHFRGEVTRYSVWNEPNYAAWLQPHAAAPAIYRALYSAGFQAIRAADPAAEVLIGETAGPAQPGRVTPALAFIRRVTCRGANLRPLAACPPLVADGYAHHPYDFDHPPRHAYPGRDDVTLGSLDRLTGALDALARAGALASPAGRGLPVYLTEFGYFATGRHAVPSGTRARYLSRAFALAAAHFPRVRQLLQYLLVEPPPRYRGGSFDTALTGPDGTPRPTFEALARFARRSSASP